MLENRENRVLSEKQDIVLPNNLQWHNNGSNHICETCVGYKIGNTYEKTPNFWE